MSTKISLNTWIIETSNLINLMEDKIEELSTKGGHFMVIVIDDFQYELDSNDFMETIKNQVGQDCGLTNFDDKNLPYYDVTFNQEYIEIRINKMINSTYAGD